VDRLPTDSPDPRRAQSRWHHWRAMLAILVYTTAVRFLLQFSFRLPTNFLTP
jgi:hypothetical protein